MSDPHAVFLNTPYDNRYEQLFVTLVGALICLGQKPHCVLEIQERGQGRLARIFELIRSCSASIHDLSRQGQPARYNMPFELGLAYSLVLRHEPHEIVVMDSVDHRLDRTLSDYKGRDPVIHHNRCDDLATAMLDVFEVPEEPAPEQVRSAARLIRRSAAEIVRRYRSKTIFKPAPYRALVAAATELAHERGFIAAEKKAAQTGRVASKSNPPATSGRTSETAAP